MYDADDGGATAARRAWDVAVETETPLDIRVAALPAGQDPADLVAAHRGEQLDQAIRAAVPLAHHLIDRAVEPHDLTDPEGPSWAIRSAAPIIAAITNPDHRAAATAHLARRVGHDVNAVQNALARFPTRGLARHQEVTRGL